MCAGSNGHTSGNFPIEQVHRRVFTFWVKSCFCLWSAENHAFSQSVFAYWAEIVLPPKGGRGSQTRCIFFRRLFFIEGHIARFCSEGFCRKLQNEQQNVENSRGGSMCDLHFLVSPIKRHEMQRNGSCQEKFSSTHPKQPEEPGMPQNPSVLPLLTPPARNFETFTTKLETPSCNFRFTKLFQSANKLHEDLAKAQHSQPKRSFALGLLFHSVLEPKHSRRLHS